MDKDKHIVRSEAAFANMRHHAGGGFAGRTLALALAKLAPHGFRIALIDAESVQASGADDARAIALTAATREAGEHGWVEFGASPRGSINLIHAARALALLRARDYVLPVDVRDLARDVLRHRIVLTYEALASGVDADRVLDDVLRRTPMPRIELAHERERAAR